MQPVQKNKRGRKRQSDEECLTEAERVKKEKNRQAAQKCREKKEKEARDLKSRNEELEKDNKKLTNEKKQLEERVKQFHFIIEDHIRKGCRLPPDVQEVYIEGKVNMSSSRSTDDAELFRAVGTIERDHTPPHTPEEPSSRNLSPQTYSQFSSLAGPPTALFSGTPLSDDEISRKRIASTSRSSSSSPALSLSPAKTAPHLPSKQRDLSSYFLTNETVPRALAPISPSGIGCPWINTKSKQIVPTVVSEIDEDSENTTEYISKSYEVIQREKNTYSNEKPNIATQSAMRFPDVPSDDEIAKQLARGGRFTYGEENKDNLPSLGFNYIPGYSYTEDLQQMESVPEITSYTTSGHQGTDHSVGSGKQSSSVAHSESLDIQPVVNVSVCAPALLDMCEEMSESLQQQIKTSYISPTSFVVEDTSDFKKSKLNHTHQNECTFSGQPFTQENLITTKSGTAQQQVCIGEGHQQIVDLHDTINYQIELKDANQVITEYKQIVLSNEQLQLLRILGLENSTVDQLLSTENPVKNPCVLQLVKKVTANGVQLINTGQQSATSATRWSTVETYSHQSNVDEMLTETSSHQSNVDEMLTETSAARLLPVGCSIPVTNLTSPGAQIFICGSSQVNNQSMSSSCPTTGETTDFPISTQQDDIVAMPGLRKRVLDNGQISEVILNRSKAQTVDLNSSTSNLDGTDYSQHVQDLPSLNLNELNSDKNIFEKKPSRLSF